MTTTITTQFNPGFTPTSSIPEVSIRTDRAQVSVTLTLIDTGEECLRVRLVPYAGMAVIADLRAVVEAAMIRAEKTASRFKLTADEAEVCFDAIYCTVAMPADVDISRGFLATGRVRVVYPSSMVSLTAPPVDGDDDELTLCAVGTTINGETATAYKEGPCPAGSRWEQSVADICAEFPSLARVSMFTVKRGGGEAVFYVSRCPFFLEFRFLNVFGVPEYLSVPCEVKRSSEVSRDTVTVGGKSRQYGLRSERKFEVTAGGVAPWMLGALEQLMGSRCVELRTAVGLLPIVITEQTLESSNDDETLPEVKFTFRFAEIRPVMMPDEVGALMPPGARSFSSTFTPQFS